MSQHTIPVDTRRTLTAAIADIVGGYQHANLPTPQTIVVRAHHNQLVADLRMEDDDQAAVEAWAHHLGAPTVTTDVNRGDSVAPRARETRHAYLPSGHPVTVWCHLANTP